MGEVLASDGREFTGAPWARRALPRWMESSPPAGLGEPVEPVTDLAVGS